MALEALGSDQSVLIIDNDNDPSVRGVAEAHHARYIAAPRNLGFAAAVNVALAERGDRDVLLLNPDARIDGQLVSELSNVLESSSDIAAVAPTLVGADGLIQRAKWPIPSPRESWVDALNIRGFVAPRAEFLIGAVLLLRSEAIDDIGGFDERFFLYAEETDWQYRAVRSGWRVMQASGLAATHVGGGSSDVESVRRRHFHSSARQFARKWYGRRGWITMRTAASVGATLRLAAKLGDAEARARYARDLRP
jgi:GT2 family glycosyltransferase